MIESEKKYPIYNISATWSQKNLDYNNGTGFSRMYEKDPGLSGAVEDAKKWWEKMIRAPRQRHSHGPPLIEIGIQLISLDVKFLGWEAWCLTWFSHYTLNVHLTDNELLESFEDFVRQKEPLHHNLELPKEQQDPNLGTYCLMGAEDRWRWKDPCRCKHCVKFGLTRIDH